MVFWMGTMFAKLFPSRKFTLELIFQFFQHCILSKLSSRRLNFLVYKKANIWSKNSWKCWELIFIYFFILRVAEWLVDLKNRGTPQDKAPQFITTSFRKEMVEVANKVVGVAMVNNASRIASIGREEAMDFITRTDV